MSKAKLAVLSNRGPLSFRVGPNDSITSHRGGGGLVSGFTDALRNSDALWISALSTELEFKAQRQGLYQLPDISLLGIPIPHDTYHDAYNTISNEILWFLYHGMFNAPLEPNFDHNFQRAFGHFRDYNQAFVDAVIECVDPDGAVIVNDYHLSLVPGMLKALAPTLKVAYFSHTPFPYPFEFAALPRTTALELASSLSGADRVGFHASRWEQNFLECLRQVGFDAPPTFVAPLPSDLGALEIERGRPEVASAREALAALSLSHPLIVRIDRMELSKNIVRGFLAIEEMMITHPHTIGKFSFLALCYPSRENVPAYLEYRDLVFETQRRINDAYSTKSWKPITLLSEDNFPRSIAALELFDVLVVNPIRDGLNLVAQEGLLLNQRNGTVVLSTEAGVYESLGEVTLGVSPLDISETASKIYQGAFELDADTRRTRHELALQILTQRSASQWFETLLETFS